MNEFGALLRRYRRMAGLSQQDLAERVTGWREDHGEISRYELGYRRPREARVVQLAEALGLAAVERDQLLVAAGYAPRDLLGWALRDEPDLLALARLVVAGNAPESVRETIRDFARLVTRQVMVLERLQEDAA